MKRRLILKLAGAAITASLAFGGAAQAADTIKFGAVAPKTGPLAGGAVVTHWPNIKLWVAQVNARGGLKLKDGQRKIEVIEYDDQTNPGETIKAVQRLVTQDKVDFLIGPYGTGFNLAVAPVFAKYGYPLIAMTAITDQIPDLAKKFPGMFFTLGSTTPIVQGLADILSKLVKDGKIGNKIAMVNVADAFGIELANAARPIFKAAGLDVVYDKSYPLGTQDLSPIVKGAKAANPDAFVAWSYPPDTFGLTGQAMVQGLDVKVFYTAVATSFPAYGGKFGAAANNVMGTGGVNPDDPAIKEYMKAHKEITGLDADFWASSSVYASLQILEQAIEGVGEVDRAKVTEYIKSHSFDTILGDITFDEHNNNAKYWTVGQWQDGVYQGVAAVGRDGAKEVRLKSGWK